MQRLVVLIIRERVLLVNSAPELGRAGSVCIPAPRAERKPYQTGSTASASQITVAAAKQGRVHANAVHINTPVKGQKEGDRVNPLR